MAAKAKIEGSVLDKVGGLNTNATREDMQQYEDAAKTFGSQNLDQAAGEGAIDKQLQQIFDGELKQLLSNIEACAASQAQRDALYAGLQEDASSVDSFRHDLLRHLAGSLVIKEHRIRYQKEQFDRFVTSLEFRGLKDLDLTLKEFSVAYSNLIDATIESSHNYRCPKIEANYDEFAEQTIKPLSSTIFFYFFSANRSGKTWAQWMLASARYPNHRMRKAYMRFFA